jgi:hypothetical protein
MMMRTTITVLLLSAPILVSAVGLKIDQEEMKALRTYCKADVERLCATVEPGGGRIKSCLMEQKKQMSVVCAQALQKLKSARQKAE